MTRRAIETLFPAPKSAEEALRQALILERAETLFTAGNYDWYISDNHAHLFGISGPKGQHYSVDMRLNTCTCKGIAKYKDCKHRLAVALSEACREASLCKQAELEADERLFLRECVTEHELDRLLAYENDAADMKAERL